MSINPHLIAVQWQLRWPIYQRLIDLEVPCDYAPYQPLRVEVNSPSCLTGVVSGTPSLCPSRDLDQLARTLLAVLFDHLE